MGHASGQLTAHSPVHVETELWQASLDGDGAAFGYLFDLHRDRVFTHAHRMTGSHPDAEDLLASAFLELWRLRDRVRLVDGSVLPWLLATTTNLGLNITRARRRYRRFLERLPRAGEQTDVADVVIDGLAVDPSIGLAMRSLKVRDAQLFALVALEGFPVAEAASCLNLSVPAARARLHRTRARLREQLADADHG